MAPVSLSYASAEIQNMGVAPERSPKDSHALSGHRPSRPDPLFLAQTEPGAGGCPLLGRAA